MDCRLCGKPLHGVKGSRDKDWNVHHYWFPKAKYKRSKKRKVTMLVHYTCHNEFNTFLTHVCKTNIPCTGCKYQVMCCYCQN